MTQLRRIVPRGICPPAYARGPALGQQQNPDVKMQAQPGDFYCPAANFPAPSGIETGLNKAFQGAGTVAAAAGGVAEKAGQAAGTAADVAGTIIQKGGAVVGGALDLASGVIGIPSWAWNHTFGLFGVSGGVGLCPPGHGHGLGLVQKSADEVVVSLTTVQSWAENNQCTHMTCRSADTGASRDFYSCHAADQAKQAAAAAQVQAQAAAVDQAATTKKVVTYVAIGGAALGALLLVYSLTKK